MNILINIQGKTQFGKVFLSNPVCNDWKRARCQPVLSPIRCKTLLDGGRRRTKIYMVFLREPSRQDRSGSDLFHLRDGFEIKMNFDRNVSYFIFVNALMHDDFFD